jgi:hypothetical protein
MGPNNTLAGGKNDQRVCKPGSVRFSKEKAAAIHLGCPLPNTSCNLPGRRPGNRAMCRLYLVLLPTGFTLPLPLQAARCALTAPFHPYRSSRKKRGGLLSVALSLESPRPGVIRRRASVEPGLSSPAYAKATTRPSDRKPEYASQRIASSFVTPTHRINKALRFGVGNAVYVGGAEMALKSRHHSLGLRVISAACL